VDYQAGEIYHIFNQGNNREKIFFKEENYLFFLKKVRVNLLPYTDVLAYCLMPNHFHLLVSLKKSAIQKSIILKPNSDGENVYQQNISNSIAILLRSYTRAINKQENRTGSLFRKNTKIKNTFQEGFLTEKQGNSLSKNDNYVKICFDYIHNNPTKARLVNKKEDWIYSSYRDYYGFRNGTLCNKDLARELGLIL